MLKLGTVRFRARCNRHPRYNPIIDGEAGIKGGCPKCHLLLEILQTHRQLISLMHRVNPPNVRTSGQRKAGTAGEQMDLFATAGNF